MMKIFKRHRKDTYADPHGSAKCRVEQERALIRHISEGDELAFENLYQLFYDRLYRFVFRVTGRLDVIEEVINDVMYVVWQKADTYNHTCQPSTWIFGIAFNKSRKSMQVSRAVSAECASNDENKGPLGAFSEDLFNRVELENWLNIGFEALSPDHRAVVELTYYHGMHYKEIAKIMDCPENTVKTRMFHARKKLALVLRQAAEAS